MKKSKALKGHHTTTCDILLYILQKHYQVVYLACEILIIKACMP